MVLRFAFLMAGLLAAATVAQAAEIVPYKRSLYKHWIDADRDCQNTRQEVLITESVIVPTLDATGCKVIGGRWLDPYTGETFTDPRKLDIDHLIPLAEVHRSGGEQWNAKRRQSYANDLFDPNTLIAVDLRANRRKGAKDPAKWMPQSDAFHCQYILRWVEVKSRWGLSMDAKERSKVQAVLAGCADAVPSPVISQPNSAPQDVTRPPLETDHPIRPPRYGQGCDCPYDRKANNYLCGGTSAYSQPGGRQPVCYTDDWC